MQSRDVILPVTGHL